MTLGSQVQIDFCSLGMFIIDEIHFLPPKQAVYDIPGGAGSYAAFGARIFCPPPFSKSIGWVVDTGSDFPEDIRARINSWQTSCMLRETPDRLSTRGWNGYDETEKRAFKYLTPKIRLDASSLSQDLLFSRSFHLICSPNRCISLVKDILALRKGMQPETEQPRPIFVWEPVPDSCVPEELESCFEALTVVDVFSPNHHELASFLGKAEPNGGDRETLNREIGAMAQIFLSRGIGPQKAGAAVIRAGKNGCFFSTGLEQLWLPAYHQPKISGENNPKIVDPTGAGNAFLGALALALVQSELYLGLETLRQAVIWGSIAASLAIEQIGLPLLSTSSNSETWNNIKVRDRVEEYEARISSHEP
ncbi:MAG: hypothetical protein M1829_005466 [Trizodia sp. TS-e1964]|nr:MAG: hypothetical protein M1829_005466 [Trizodia sp. TS-e1964]